MCGSLINDKRQMTPVPSSRLSVIPTVPRSALRRPAQIKGERSLYLLPWVVFSVQTHTHTHNLGAKNYRQQKYKHPKTDVHIIHTPI